MDSTSVALQPPSGDFWWLLEVASDWHVSEETGEIWRDV